MPKSPLAAVYDHWTQPSYEIRVRGTTPPTYLWGSAGIKKNIPFNKPLVLHVRNDVFGEPITIGTQVAAGPQTAYGTLNPGECVSIPVQDISGVFATCPPLPSALTVTIESTVGCLIKS